MARLKETSSNMKMTEDQESWFGKSIILSFNGFQCKLKDGEVEP